jgi:glucose dehydrogenase
MGNRESGIEGNWEPGPVTSMRPRAIGAAGVIAAHLALGCAPSSGAGNASPFLSAEGARKPNEWPVYGGDAGGLKYSPLTTIDRSDVSRLTVAWTWKTGEQPVTPPGATIPARPGQFQVTPLAIGDTLFLSTPFNRVVALDAATGRELWAYDPHAYDAGQPSNVE